MKITKKTYVWDGRLSLRSSTEYIVLHHAASQRCSADDIHRIHISNGWAGIGYHFYIRKDGTVYEGRPLDTVGAHVQGFNSKSIGICFEGNFEKEKMTDAQLRSGIGLVGYIKALYPFASVKKHSDLNATVCPGKYFPFDAFFPSHSELTEVKDIITELNKRGIVTNAALWESKCASDANSYNLAKKICNTTKMGTKRPEALESVNDIVWELWHRGIIDEKSLWLSLMKKDVNLYWLGYKAANFTEAR